jgi:hypothetical protein
LVEPAHDMICHILTLCLAEPRRAPEAVSPVSHAS